MIDYKTRSARFVFATKALVDELLSMNTHNRSMKTDSIGVYKKSMELGQWTPTNQGIGVSVTGVLLDGQNRLEACRLLGYPPIEFLLVTGLDDEAQMHIDVHARRTQADIIKLALNQSVSSKCLSALNARQTFKTKGPKDRLTVDDLALEFRAHGEVLARLLSSLRKFGRAPVVAALLDYSLLVGEGPALTLAEQIGGGEMLERDDPAYRVRQHLEQARSANWQSHISDYRRMISACAAHFRKNRLTILKETEDWPSDIRKPVRA